MLRTLGSPLSLLGLLVGFLAAVLVQRYAHAAAARLLGERSLGGQRGGFRLAAAGASAGRRAGGPVESVRAAIDPFGAVAALIAGPGWGVVPDLGLRRPARIALALLAGPLAAAAVGALALAGYVAAGGSLAGLAGVGPGDVVAAGGVDLPALRTFCLCAGVQALGVAVLALVPLPPLPGWGLLELVSAGSPGWQRARYYLVDKNVGVLALLVLLILPLGGGTPLLVLLVDTVVGALLDLA